MLSGFALGATVGGVAAGGGMYLKARADERQRIEDAGPRIREDQKVVSILIEAEKLVMDIHAAPRDGPLSKELLKRIDEYYSQYNPTVLNQLNGRRLFSRV